MDLRKLAKLPNLELLNTSFTGLNLDLLNVSAEEIAASKSKVSLLDLTGTTVNSGIVFAKIKLFPLVELVDLTMIPLKQVDLAAIRQGGLQRLSIIRVDSTTIDSKWLEETAPKLSMQLARVDDVINILVEYQPDN